MNDARKLRILEKLAAPLTLQQRVERQLVKEAGLFSDVAGGVAKAAGHAAKRRAKKSVKAVVSRGADAVGAARKRGADAVEETWQATKKKGDAAVDKAKDTIAPEAIPAAERRAAAAPVPTDAGAKKGFSDSTRLLATGAGGAVGGAAALAGVLALRRSLRNRAANRGIGGVLARSGTRRNVGITAGAGLAGLSLLATRRKHGE